MYEQISLAQFGEIACVNLKFVHALLGGTKMGFGQGVERWRLEVRHVWTEKVS